MVVCVFGASGAEIDKKYIEQTEMLGEKLAQRGHSLMFGGGKFGLMGAAARGFRKGGGHITGVIPTFFGDYDVIYDCDEFKWTENMRDRKKYMEDNSDAFIITPGGIGTYEEFLEVLTLKQLARLSKPIVIFNVNGFFDKLLSVIDDNVKDGFIRPQTPELFKVTDNIDEAISIVETDSYDIEKIKFYD